MTNKNLLRTGATVLAMIGLGACVDGGGYGGSDRYDRYYGRSSGYRAVPYGYAGTGFGWYGESYYPGTGEYVYDRRGRRQNWNDDQRGYWQNHARPADMQRHNGRDRGHDRGRDGPHGG